MNEIIDTALAPVNIILSILVLLLIVYWLFTMISGMDFDLDVDVDIDADVDIDTDSGLDAGNVDFAEAANTEINKEDVVKDRRKALKWWQIVLIYFNFVGLPFMFTFTCWIFVWWLCTILSTSITGSYDNSFGYLLFLAGILPSLILTKIITTPFKSFFRNLNQDGDAPIDITGRIGTLLSTISGSKMGSAEVMADGNPMAIYVKSLDGEKLNYNQRILVIKQSDDKNYFYVKPYNN